MQLLISPRMVARAPASRLESGSSKRQRRVRRTSARPRATRWRCPPESSRGRRASSGRMSRRPAISRTRRSISSRGPGHLEGEADVAPHVEVRIERVALEDHGGAAPSRGERSFTISPSMTTLPCVGALEAGHQVQHRGFAAAARPDQGHERAIGDLNRCRGAPAPRARSSCSRCRGVPRPRDQPFTAPAVRPVTSQRWKSSATRMTGSVATTEAAAICPTAPCARR